MSCFFASGPHFNSYMLTNNYLLGYNKCHSSQAVKDRLIEIELQLRLLTKQS
jgi:hypothetical protein